MKNMFWIVISLLIALTLFSCKKDDEKDDTHISNCCKEDATIASFPSGLDSIPTSTIYIPNIFTPDGDGYNELFTVFGSSIKNINSILILDNGVQIFEESDIVLNMLSGTWDGTNVDNATLNRIYDYQVTVTTLGDIEYTFNGQVATVVCNDAGGGVPEHLDNCKFPSQYNDMGNYDPQAPSFEENIEDCFN